MLLEGNHLLRAKVGALGGRHFNQDAVEFKSARVKYTALLQNSCALVADHMLRRVQQAVTSPNSPSKNTDGLWDKIVAYYIASHVPLKEIFSRMGAQCPAVTQLHSKEPLKGADLMAVQALCAIVRHYVFVPSHRELVAVDDAALAADVLHLFWHVDANSLARVILESTWHTYDTDQAMELVRYGTSPMPCEPPFLTLLLWSNVAVVGYRSCPGHGTKDECCVCSWNGIGCIDTMGSVRCTLV